MVFFTKGRPTETVWLYDARTNVPGITKKDRPLTDAHFAEFENATARTPTANESAGRRIRRGTVEGFRHQGSSRREFKLDSFKWLKEESLEDADDLPEPEELAGEAVTELEAAVSELNAVLAFLGNGGA